MTLKQSDVFKCNQCANRQSERVVTRTVEMPGEPWKKIKVTESHIDCARVEDVSNWRRNVYLRAWAAVYRLEDAMIGKSRSYVSRMTAAKWDDVRGEYENGPCLFFEAKNETENP